MFPDRFPHYAWTAQSAHSGFAGCRVYACLGVTCHLHCWQNVRGLLFSCHCSNTGLERTPNKSQHTKSTLEKKISRRSSRDSNSQPFDHESGALTNKLSRLPRCLQTVKIPYFCYCCWHATPPARDFFLANFYPSGPFFTCIFSKTSPEFFPVFSPDVILCG